MKYIVTLKRKQTTNAAQNARKMRVEVNANSEIEAKAIALFKDNKVNYFTAESARRA
ncbi:MAG: hypothetical protein WBK19_10440 [Azonexus sp.]